MALSIRQNKFLQAYVKSGVIIKACEEIGLNKGTFYYWLKTSEEFKNKFEEIKKRVEKELFDRVNSLIPKAFDVLEKELESENSYIRLRAVSLILDVYHKQKELNLEERLEKIEELINENKR